MKLKKLLAILLAVILVLAMTVSVSAKRFYLGDKQVIGTLAWSGTPYVNEVITATTKMDVGFCTLTAKVHGSYMDNNGVGSGTRWAPDASNVGYSASTYTSVQNGYWTSATANYSASYDSNYASESETKTW